MSDDYEPLSTAEHIAQAKALVRDGAASSATAHALIAIAELMSTNMAQALVDSFGHGATSTAEALGSLYNLVNPAGVSANTVFPCTVKSAGGRVCIRDAGHPGDHRDDQRWEWESAGEHAHPRLFDDDGLPAR